MLATGQDLDFSSCAHVFALGTGECLLRSKSQPKVTALANRETHWEQEQST